MAKKRVSKKTARKKPNVIKKKVSKKPKVMKKAGKRVSKRTSKIGFRIPFTRFTFSLVVCLALMCAIYSSSLSGITGMAAGDFGGLGGDYSLIAWAIVIIVVIAIFYFFLLKGKK